MLAERRPIPATLRDLDNLPEEVVAHLVDGELIVHPRPEGPHVEAASELGWMLMGPFRHGMGGPGGGSSSTNRRSFSAPQLLVPDLAGWKKKRFVATRKGPYTVAPDWVCEILSPSTRRFDRSAKLPSYTRAGVGHAWVLDPGAQTLEVLRLHEGRWLIVSVHKGRGSVRAEPFDTVALDLSLIWSDASLEGEQDDAADLKQADTLPSAG